VGPNEETGTAVRGPAGSASSEPEGGGTKRKGQRTETRHAYRHFGWPQVFACLLLLVFLAQGVWLAIHVPFDADELSYLRPQASPELPAARSPATVLLARVGSIAASPELHPSTGAPPHPSTPEAGVPGTPPLWPVRVPFLLVGTALGASLWYVARRLCGNTGGGVALALYTFSPSMLTYSARVRPETIAAWSVFGCIFTSIAVAHTLYAPREVILWNWKRILLLGTALGLSAASHLATATVAALGLAFMLYLVPERSRAALAIMGAALAVGCIWFGGLERLRLEASSAAALGNLMPKIPGDPGWAGQSVALQLLRDGPGFLLLLLSALGALAVWRRPRFFGTLAPLLAAAFVLLCGAAFPAPGFSFMAVALPFLFVFTAGVWADLLQSRLAPLTAAILLAALAIHAYWPHAKP